MHARKHRRQTQQTQAKISREITDLQIGLIDLKEGIKNLRQKDREFERKRAPKQRGH